MPMTRRNVPTRCLMTRSQSRASARNGSREAMSRSRRTYVLAVAVAAIVTAGEREPGRLLLAIVGAGSLWRSSSRPRSLLIIERASCLVGCASRSRASWWRARRLDRACRPSWSISAAGVAARGRAHARVHRARARARPRTAARRRAGRARAASVSACPLICGYALATRLASRPLRRVRRSDQSRTGSPSRSDTGTRSGCSRRSALLVVARVRGARSAHVGCAASRAGFDPGARHDAVLHILARCVGGAHPRLRSSRSAVDPRRLRLLWIALVVAVPAAACHRVRVAARCAHDGGRRSRRGQQRGGHRARRRRLQWHLVPQRLRAVGSARAVSRRIGRLRRSRSGV